MIWIKLALSLILSNGFAYSQDSGSLPATDCCTCDEALYEMKFQGIWSKQTHPKDYPESEWLIHWSDIAGASHTQDFKIWEYGGMASPAVKRVAEYGDTSKLERELKKKAKDIRTIIKIKGLYHPNVQGSAKANIRVDKYRHLVSFLTMLGPSPDWLTGLDSSNLCTKNCTWSPGLEIALRPIDAGTDSGISYMSPNQPTIPQIAMRPLTKIDPNDALSPWFDANIASRHASGLIKSTDSNKNEIPSVVLVKPVAKVTFTLLKVYEGTCNADFYKKYASLANTADSGSDSSTKTEIDMSSDEFMRKKLIMMGGSVNTEGPCATTIWSEWSPCSVTCGKGITMRKRYLLMPEKEAMCKTTLLLEKGMCLSDIPDCSDVPHPKCALKHWGPWSPCSSTCGKGMRFRTREYENEQGAAMMNCPYSLMEKELCMERPECDNSHDSRCHTTVWSSWSDCSVSCGTGIRYRSRHYVTPKIAKKHCGEDLIEKESCHGESGSTCEENASEKANFNSSDTIYNNLGCQVSLWSEWSPCTATCGTGSRIRTRYFIGNNKFQIKRGELVNTWDSDYCQQSQIYQDTKLIDVEPCIGVQADCVKNTTMSKVHCRQSPVKGPCRGQFFRWYYNPMLRQCRRFWYGGCQGNDNNFYNYLDCKEMCEKPMGPLRDQDYNEDIKLVSNANQNANKTDNLACMYSEWSDWAPCSKTCGRGFSKRFRMLKGKTDPTAECNDDLFQDKYCNEKSCTNECQYGLWTEWSICENCESGSVQMRKRPLLIMLRARNALLGCQDLIEKRECQNSYSCTKNYPSSK